VDEDGVGDGETVSSDMPLPDRRPARDDDGGAPEAIVEDPGHLASAYGVDWGHAPVVENRQFDVREASEEFQNFPSSWTMHRSAGSRGMRR